jgi:phosphatidylglycerophosphate synthase
MKKDFLKRIPYLLTYCRLLMAAYYVVVSLFTPLQDPLPVGIVLFAAILTDILDGVLARKWKCDTVHMRQLDSKVDTAFWFALLYLLLVMYRPFITDHAPEIFILIGSEIILQVFAYFKFNRSLALHTYAAKGWTILLTLSVFQLLLGNDADSLFKIAFVWGLLTQSEVAVIVIKMKTFRVDVKSILNLYFDSRVPTSHIREVIMKIPFLHDCTSSFSVSTYKRSIFKTNLTLCFELRDKLSFLELNLIHQEVSRQIVMELERMNADFKRNFSRLANPKIEFYSLGEGPFREGRKETMSGRI